MKSLKSKFGSKLAALAVDPLSSAAEPVSPALAADCDHIWGPFYISGKQLFLLRSLTRSSDYSTAQNKDFLLSMGFTHIVVCAASCLNLFEDAFTYYRLDLNDRVNESLLHVIQRFITLMDELKGSDAKILLHCKEGKSRAPTVLSGYLVWRLGISFEEAISMVRARRPKIDPNFGFLLRGTAAFQSQLSSLTEAASCRLGCSQADQLRGTSDFSDIVDIRLGPTPLQSKISPPSQAKSRPAGKIDPLERRSKSLSQFKPKKTNLKNIMLQRVKRRMQWKRSTSSTSTTVSESSPRRAPCSV